MTFQEYLSIGFDVSKLEELLARGFDPNGFLPGTLYSRPLSWAINEFINKLCEGPLDANLVDNAIEFVSILLKHGADPNYCICDYSSKQEELITPLGQLELQLVYRFSDRWQPEKRLPCTRLQQVLKDFGATEIVFP